MSSLQSIGQRQMELMTLFFSSNPDLPRIKIATELSDLFLQESRIIEAAGENGYSSRLEAYQWRHRVGLEKSGSFKG